MNANELLSLGIYNITHRAYCGDSHAYALCQELARLYVAAGEPLPWQLEIYAPSRPVAYATEPSEYVLTQRNELLREPCPDDDGPDALEDV